MEALAKKESIIFNRVFLFGGAGVGWLFKDHEAIELKAVTAKIKEKDNH